MKVVHIGGDILSALVGCWLSACPQPTRNNIYLPLPAKVPSTFCSTWWIGQGSIGFGSWLVEFGCRCRSTARAQPPNIPTICDEHTGGPSTTHCGHQFILSTPSAATCRFCVAQPSAIVRALRRWEIPSESAVATQPCSAADGVGTRRTDRQKLTGRACDVFHLH